MENREETEDFLLRIKRRKTEKEFLQSGKKWSVNEKQNEEEEEKKHFLDVRMTRVYREKGEYSFTGIFLWSQYTETKNSTFQISKN